MLGILCGAVWMNAHALPHGVVVFEARGLSGHGARWSVDGQVPPPART